MSKAMEAVSLRRLARLFTNSTVEVRKLQNLAEQFKKSCESSRFRNIDKQAYSRTVQNFASAKQFSLIDDILQHQKKYKEISHEGFVLRLIKLYGKAGMFEHAQKLFDEMPKLNCERTVKSVSALLSACLHSKKFDKVGRLLEELPEKAGVELDLFCYNIVIKAFCEMGDMDSALSVLDILEKKRLEPDIITFNTLLNGFFSKGRIADGEEIWCLMERKNVVPDILSYNSKLRGLIYESKMMEAVEFLEEMKSKGTKPDNRSYNILIKGYCINGNLEQAMKWYNKLKLSCSPDRVTYLTLILFLCKKNDFEMAIEFCKEAIHRRVVLEKKLIDVLVQQSMIEEAIQLVEIGKSRYGLKLKLPRDA